MIPAVAFVAAGFAAPALAQDADAPATNIAIPAPATNSADTVGPSQLRNFSLQGTVTRKADTPPAAEPRPAPTQGVATGAPAPARPAAPVTASPRRPALAQREAPAPTAAAPSAASAFPTVSGTEPPTTFTPALPSPEPAATPVTAPLVPAAAGPESGMLSYWPWLLALLAAAGAALWYFRRPRSSYAFAGATPLPDESHELRTELTPPS